MASDINFVQFIVDQIGNLESIRYRKMFGEKGTDLFLSLTNQSTRPEHRSAKNRLAEAGGLFRALDT